MLSHCVLYHSTLIKFRIPQCELASFRSLSIAMNFNDNFKLSSVASLSRLIVPHVDKRMWSQAWWEKALEQTNKPICMPISEPARNIATMEKSIRFRSTPLSHQTSKPSKFEYFFFSPLWRVVVKSRENENFHKQPLVDEKRARLALAKLWRKSILGSRKFKFACFSLRKARTNHNTLELNILIRRLLKPQLIYLSSSMPFLPFWHFMVGGGGSEIENYAMLSHQTSSGCFGNMAAIARPNDIRGSLQKKEKK